MAYPIKYIENNLVFNHGGAIGYQGWNGACSSKQQMLVYGYGTANPDPRLKAMDQPEFY